MNKLHLKLIPDDKADAYAIQAFVNGQASPDQQLRAAKCIIDELCGAYTMTFDPESRRVSDFAEGKRHIGRALSGLSNANLGIIFGEQTPIEPKEPSEQPSKRGK